MRVQLFFHLVKDLKFLKQTRFFGNSVNSFSRRARSQLTSSSSSDDDDHFCLSLIGAVERTKNQFDVEISDDVLQLDVVPDEPSKTRSEVSNYKFMKHINFQG